MGERKMEIDPKITANRQRAIAQNRCYRGHTKHAYSDEFYTPPEIPAALGTFDIDPCAGHQNMPAATSAARRMGFLAIWRGRLWLNPPYSRLEDWLTRFVDHGNGIALVNAAPRRRMVSDLRRRRIGHALSARSRPLQPARSSIRRAASWQRAGSLRAAQCAGPGAERPAGHHHLPREARPWRTRKRT